MDYDNSLQGFLSSTVCGLKPTAQVLLDPNGDKCLECPADPEASSWLSQMKHDIHDEDDPPVQCHSARNVHIVEWDTKNWDTLPCIASARVEITQNPPQGSGNSGGGAPCIPVVRRIDIPKKTLNTSRRRRKPRMPADHNTIVPNMDVVLHGLKGLSYNGAKGIVKRWDEVENKWHVTLTCGTRLTVKPKNIRVRGPLPLDPLDDFGLGCNRRLLFGLQGLSRDVVKHIKKNVFIPIPVP